MLELLQVPAIIRRQNLQSVQAGVTVPWRLFIYLFLVPEEVGEIVKNLECVIVEEKQSK